MSSTRGTAQRGHYCRSLCHKQACKTRLYVYVLREMVLFPLVERRRRLRLGSCARTSLLEVRLGVERVDLSDWHLGSHTRSFNNISH